MSNHNREKEAELIYIPDEDGNEEEFEVIMKFDMDDSDARYMMVVPVAEGDDSEYDEVYAFRYEEDGDELKLFTIESDEEWEMVEETFNALLSEHGEDGEDS